MMAGPLQRLKERDGVVTLEVEILEKPIGETNLLRREPLMLGDESYDFDCKAAAIHAPTSPDRGGSGNRTSRFQASPPAWRVYGRRLTAR